MRNDIALKIENLSKQYRLGLVGTNTLRGDLQAWWHRIRGKEDPTLKIGQENKLAESGGKHIWALQDINLEVKKGEVLGIIGKNGAGKSTLLKILSRVTGPTTGKVEINGSISSLLEVGTGMHPELTGRENIFLNGAILGMTKSEIRKKIDEIIDFAGIAKYIDTPVKRYSSGMRVRLGFAVAAFLEPDILIVDEVLAVGDAEFQKKAIGKMQDVSKGEGRTVLFVSHNMGSVQSLCSRAIVLENGKINYEGNTADSIKKYLNKQVSQSKIHLSNRKDRKGNGYLKFTDIKIYNISSKSFAIFSGANVDFMISFEVKQTLKSVNFKAIIVDNEDNVKFISNNSHSNRPYETINKNGLVSFNLKKLPLPKGEYYIHISAYAKNVLLDSVNYSCEFNVEDGDFFGTGKSPGNKKGLLVDYNWREIK